MKRNIQHALVVLVDARHYQLHHMKRNIRHALVVLTALLCFAGCDTKDPIYNTAHPDHGKVTLTTDWSVIGKGLTVPPSYNVAAGGYSATLSGATNTLHNLFEPGKYRIRVYNTPERISVTGNVAAVSEASGNVDGAGKFVDNTPGWLFSAVTDTVIAADTDYVLTATMHQQVRQLTLLIAPSGGTTDKIENIEGYLSGAAGTLDIDTDTHGNASNIELNFVRITEGADAGKWSATVRLLGIAGPQQKLNALIRFTGNRPSPVHLDNDLTSELAAFNTDKRTPLTLGGKVVGTSTEAGFNAIINDWIPVSGSGTAD